MARRATLFSQIRAEGAPTLFLSGGYALTPVKGDAPKADVLAALVKGYDLLKYDAGLLTAEEAKALHNAKLKSPSAWQPLTTPPSVLTLKKGSYNIGVVFFPPLPDGAVEPPPALIQSVLSAAAALAPKVSLVVGVSSWGLGAEERFHVLSQKTAFHIILGSGDGVGLGGKLLNNGKTLWMRTYDRGKAILRINILAMPENTEGWMWMPGGNIQYQPQTILDTLSPDQEMSKLFAPFPQDVPKEEQKPASPAPVSARGSS